MPVSHFPLSLLPALGVALVLASFPLFSGLSIVSRARARSLSGGIWQYNLSVRMQMSLIYSMSCAQFYFMPIRRVYISFPFPFPFPFQYLFFFSYFFLLFFRRFFVDPFCLPVSVSLHSWFDSFARLGIRDMSHAVRDVACYKANHRCGPLQGNRRKKKNRKKRD